MRCFGSHPVQTPVPLSPGDKDKGGSQDRGWLISELQTDAGARRGISEIVAGADMGSQSGPMALGHAGFLG